MAAGYPVAALVMEVVEHLEEVAPTTDLPLIAARMKRLGGVKRAFSCE